MVRRSRVLHAPAAKVVREKLGRPVQLMKDPIVKGKLTGMALHIPTINISAVDLIVNIGNRPHGKFCAEVNAAQRQERLSRLD